MVTIFSSIGTSISVNVGTAGSKLSGTVACVIIPITPIPSTEVASDFVVKLARRPNSCNSIHWYVVVSVLIALECKLKKLLIRGSILASFRDPNFKLSLVQGFINH